MGLVSTIFKLRIVPFYLLRRFEEFLLHEGLKNFFFVEGRRIGIAQHDI